MSRFKDWVMDEQERADEQSEGIFRDHACWKCNDGAKPCVQGHPRRCEYPHARND